MGNVFNEDFQDFLKSLNNTEVKYVLVGGYSVIFHGFPRTTGDLDIFVEVSEENYLKLQKAFSLFDMVINLRDLIKNKKASGRAKDLNDIENLDHDNQK